MIKGHCHCGAVTFEILETPEYLTECNCSICRRLAVQWVYSDKSRLRLNAPAKATISYIWGDRDIAFHSCNTCGCTTHYRGLSDDRIAINARLCEPHDLSDVPIRLFDGADSWEYLD